MITQVLHCPYCQGTDIVRHGTTSEGKQRYRCRACSRTWTDISLGLCLRRSLACCEATDRRDGDECEWHPRYRAGVARESYHGHQRTKKKAPDIHQVNQAALQHLPPGQVEVEICRADMLAPRRGRTSELDEMWSYVGKKAEPRWLWHAIDHHSGTVLAYVFGRPGCGLSAAASAAGAVWHQAVLHGGVGRLRAPSRSCTAHVGKQYRQTIESKHINLRTRIQRLVRRTICFSKTTTMHDLVLVSSLIATSLGWQFNMESTDLKHLPPWLRRPLCGIGHLTRS